MRRHAKATPARSKLRKPAGHGASLPSGRLRLAILAATVAAFLLVPVAQAAALGTLKVNITGSGSGEVKSEWGFTNIGTPALACSYASPGPAAGSPIPCENEMAELEPGVGIVNLLSTPAPGSVVASVIVNEGVDFTPEALGVGCNEAVGQEELQPLLEEVLGVSGWVCLVGGGGNAEVTVTFTSLAPPEFPLTVTKTGAGTGTVQCDTGSGPEACKAEYPEGTEVTLTAKGTGTGYFTGWTGSGCVGTGSCEVTMSEAKAVSANFGVGSVLTVVKAAEGTVTSNPGGIECGSECEAAFETGGTVTLTASPATENAFSKWKGCTTAAGLTCTVTMSEAKTVTATFVSAPAITVEKPNGAASGKVKAVVSCELACTSATARAKASAVVKVSATPGVGYEAVSFTGSTGSASACTVLPCEFTITEATKVKATFATIPKANLTVKVVGPAANIGKVTSSPKGISCASGPCSITNEFAKATPVTLTVAPPKTGYEFAGWKAAVGTCTGKTTPCEVSLSGGNKTVEAEFK